MQYPRIPWSWTLLSLSWDNRDQDGMDGKKQEDMTLFWCVVSYAPWFASKMDEISELLEHFVHGSVDVDSLHASNMIQNSEAWHRQCDNPVE